MIQRLAWFSPMPPVRSGVAAVNAVLVPALRRWFEIDVFGDRLPGPSGGSAGPVRSAHDFVWLHRQRPYDLTVFQLGNSSSHDYMWPYLFRYPGLVVLHDARLHHARAAALLRQRRANDYRAEFEACHPEARDGAAELAVAGFDSPIHYQYPMTRLVLARSRLTVVHTKPLADALREEVPSATVQTVALGHGTPATRDDEGARIRAKYGIPPDAVVFGCFGGLSLEKRLPQILEAFSVTRAYAPSVRLLLAGDPAAHYDLRADIRRLALEAAVVTTGYLETDDELDAHVAASDVALNLRWPTAREVSGPWLRCLARGVPTVITQLAHLTHVPWLDPRTWTSSPGDRSTAPVCVGIDILDEAHSLRLAMRRLAGDEALRRTLGAAGLAWWRAHHATDRMIDEYRRVIAATIERPIPDAAPLPPHVLDDGRRTLLRELARFALQDPLG